MNVPLIRWLCRRPEEIWVQFHEVALGWQLWRKPHHHLIHGGAALDGLGLGAEGRPALRVHRGMASPGWVARRRRAVWLPIPSNLPVVGRHLRTARARRALGPGPWIAHFGTYGSGDHPRLSFRRSRQIARTNDRGPLSSPRPRSGAGRSALPGDRVLAPGELPAEAVAARLSVADARASALSGRNQRPPDERDGCAGPRSPCRQHRRAPDRFGLERRDAVALAPPATPRSSLGACLELLADPERREALGRRGALLYARCFSLERTLETLLPGAGC